MIIPNLMVTDMARAIAFYRDTVGMTVAMMISPRRDMVKEGEEADAVFATLDWDGGQLMLQTVASLAEELPVFDAGQRPAPAGTIYFRGLHPNTVMDRVHADHIVKGPVLQWYGMLELYLRDPDGHVVCLGAPEGAPPA